MKVTKEILRDRQNARRVLKGKNGSAVANGSRPSQETSVRVEDISAKISRDYEFPDPELVVRLGLTACLFGFNPWQVRLSEIILFNPIERTFDHYAPYNDSEAPKNKNGTSANLRSLDTNGHYNPNGNSSPAGDESKSKSSSKTTMNQKRTSSPLSAPKPTAGLTVSSSSSPSPNQGLDALTEFYSVLVTFSKCQQRFGKWSGHCDLLLLQRLLF